MSCQQILRKNKGNAMTDNLNISSKNDEIDSSYSLMTLNSLTSSTQHSNKADAEGFYDVIFLNVSENHPFDTDLTTNFKISLPTYQIHPSDVIGLYRVGWKSVTDYVCSQSMSTAQRVLSSEDEHSNTYSVTFKADVLPKEEGEFFQLCYILCENSQSAANSRTDSTSENPNTKSSPSPENNSTIVTQSQDGPNKLEGGRVKGTSSPFQFIDDDFEILDQAPSLDAPWMRDSDILWEKYGYLVASGPEYSDVRDILEKDISERVSLSRQMDAESFATPKKTTQIVQTENSLEDKQRFQEDEVKNLLRKQEDEKKCLMQKYEQEKKDFMEKYEDEKKCLMQKYEEEKKELVESYEDERKAMGQKIADLKMQLTDKDRELLNSRSRVEELESAIYALTVAKESLAERVVKQDKERLMLMEMLKNIREELDQIKIAYSEYQKVSSCSKMMEMPESSRMTNSTSALPPDGQVNCDDDLLFGNPYKGYRPTTMHEPHVYHEFNQFA